MSPLMQSLGIDQLSYEDRLELVSEIWENLIGEVESSSLTAEEEEEIDFRVAAYHNDPESASDWESVKGTVLARLRK